MKSLIKLHDLELRVIHDGRNILDLKGDNIIKELIKDEFKKEIKVLKPFYRNAKDIETLGNVVETLKPGDRNYIRAILFKKINGNMNMKIIYNINNRRLYE